MILPRCDYAGAFVFDAGAVSSPGTIAATITDEGYLLADAYLARDGCLPYSDGRESWIEYRPTSELERAAQTFGPLQPITDNHPAAMVDSDTWAQVARGVHLTSAEVVTMDGVTYLRAPIAIMDRALVARAIARHERGDSVELSIGVWSDVRPTANGTAPDGTRCDALQTGLIGNHTALVPRGRAGPMCRIVFDGAAVPVSQPYREDSTMPITPQFQQFLAQPGARVQVPANMPARAPQPQPQPQPAARADMMGGGAVDQVMYPGPNGPEALPTWAAALLERLSALEAQAAGGQSEPAPTADAAPAVPPAVSNPERDESMDSAMASVRRRSRFERIAGRVGIKDAAIDAADDDTLGRMIVVSRCPWAGEQAKAARGDALDALVGMAMAQPEKGEDKGEARTDSADPWALAGIPQPGKAQARAAVGAPTEARTDGAKAPAVGVPGIACPQVIDQNPKARTDSADETYDENLAIAAGLIPAPAGK